jgi:hypothetical protein
MIEIFAVRIYMTVYYWTMFVICLLTGLYFYNSAGCRQLLKNYTILLPLLLSIIIIGYLGLRPFSWAFGDMLMYRHKWNMTDAVLLDDYFNLRKEWFFDFVLRFCKILVNDAQFWFVIVELFYVGCQFWACKRLLWENVWMAIAFVFFSYQFGTYGTNGIRNGMACALMMLSISFYLDRNKYGFVVGTIIFLLAMGCHRSVMIPMAALLVSMFIIKDIKYAIYIWLGCIFLSLVSGNFFQGLFGGLGLDDRMSNYSEVSDKTLSQFSHLGFRWDFLLYSAMPVWLAWIVRSRGVFDQTFTLLANTYIIANSFWVLVCRVAFSNRFAYLSWFLYALVIAYAVIRVPIWKNQDKVAGQILMAHTAFTITMFLIGR